MAVTTRSLRLRGVRLPGLGCAGIGCVAGVDGAVAASISASAATTSGVLSKSQRESESG